MASTKAKQMDIFIGGMSDSSQRPLRDYRVYFWESSGASTPKTVWGDIDKNEILDQTNGVALGNSGQRSIYGDGEYYIQIKTPEGILHDSFTASYASGTDFGGIYNDVASDYGTNGASLQDAINETNSNLSYIFLLKNNTFVLSGDLTFPSNIILKIEPTATINLSGYNLTIERTPEIGDYQVFTGAGNVIYGSMVKSVRGIWRNGDSGEQFIDFKTQIRQNGSPALRNINVSFGYLYVDGGGNFSVSELSSPAMGVSVDDRGESTYYGRDTHVYVSKNTSLTEIAIPSNDSINPRWDLLEIDVATGTYSINQGVASNSPAYPVLSSDKEPIAYIYVRGGSTAIYNRDILDARNSIKNKSVDGHFKTNFSIDQKEDTEPSETSNQQVFQQIPFGTKFDYVQSDKTRLQSVETVVVPATPVNGEIVYTGLWGEVTSSDYSFGVVRTSPLTSQGTATLSFTGVSCSVSIYETSNSQSSFYVELSADDGVTWTNKKTMAVNSFSGGRSGVIYSLYQGLDYGNYKVRISNNVVDEFTYMSIESFQYATYMTQAPITQNALKSQSPSSIADVPPMTTLFDDAGGNSNIVHPSSDIWNSSFIDARSNNQTFEFSFYGDKIYFNVFVGVALINGLLPSNTTISVEIDGETTGVKSENITLPNYHASRSVWVRLDNGNLSEGVHTVKITTVDTSSGPLIVSGWGTYSSKAPTTCARSLICGKDSYSVGIDDSSFVFVGSWSEQDSSNAFLGRFYQTSTASDYVTIMSPENVKAIYLISTYQSNYGELKISLGGASSNVRYISLKTSGTFGQTCVINPLYDSYMDGIDLDSQELRITNNGAHQFSIHGVIFECGEPVEKDYVNCMPKWTRYNNSMAYRCPVSSSQRIDVYGSKSDGSEGTKPMVHSGFCYVSANNSSYYRHGLNIAMEDYLANVWHGLDSNPPFPYSRPSDQSILINSFGDAGLVRINGSGANTYKKTQIHLRRVI